MIEAPPLPSLLYTYMGVGQGGGGLNPPDCETSANLLEIRFGRPVCGTILGGAHSPPYFERGESKKKGPVAC